jgi:anaerobic selenocysteine-containing dehydrogenase
MRFTLDAEGRIVKARGDHDHPVTQGYACIKGLTLHEQHYSPDRLLHPLKRMPDGSFRRVALEEALDEIADRVGALIAAHGGQTVAGFRGTLAYSNALLPALLEAIGSNSFFSTMTIDQSAKWVTADRLGTWEAGRDPFDVSDVLLMAGTNPLVSLTTFNFPVQNPAKQMRAAKAQGLKLIVVDPRATETARHADVFLQPLPGEDAVLFAGLLHLVLLERWEDAEFCARHVEGLDTLRDAVRRFTPDVVARRTGVGAGDLMAAARMFAGSAANADGARRKRGSAASGTGVDMGPHSNLAEHLLECLNVVCGRFAREGDRLTNPGIFATPRPRRAQVVAPRRSWEHGWRSAGGYGQLNGEKMTGALADEILTTGPDRIRALIVEGGNPANAVPGQARMVEALRALELLVVVEPFMTNTARLAHFILPPLMMLERTLCGNRDYEAATMVWPYSQYARPVIAPPEGAELVEEWETAFELARRLGRTLALDDHPMDMTVRPTTHDLNAFRFRNSRVPFAEIASRPAGHVFDLEPVFVAPADPAADARFQVAPADVVAEMDALAAEGGGSAAFPYRLAVRRTREVLNTMNFLDCVRARVGDNPALMNPADLATLGVANGEAVRLRSPYGSVTARVEADPATRAGVVSLSHGWGRLPDDPDDGSQGANSNRLTSLTAGRDPINAMPVMTGVPLRIERGP